MMMDLVLEAVFGAERDTMHSFNQECEFFQFIHPHDHQQKTPHVHHYIILLHSLLYAKKKKNQ